MKIKEARSKYFNMCVEIENNLLDLKFESLYFFNFNFYLNNKFLDIESKIKKYIINKNKKEHISEYHSNEHIDKMLKNRMELFKDDWSQNGLMKFFEKYIRNELHSLFTILRSELKWTNGDAIKSLLKKHKTKHSKIKRDFFDIYDDLASREILWEVNENNEFSIKKLSENERKKLRLAKKNINRYIELRNVLAHSRDEDELNDKSYIFVSRDFLKFYNKIDKMHKRYIEHWTR